MKKLVQVSVFSVCALTACTLVAGRASLRVFVVDSETEKPIPNVKIEGSFLNYSRGWGIPAKDNDVDAWTGLDGSAKFSGWTEKMVGGYRIYGHKGYYNREWVEYRFEDGVLSHLGELFSQTIASTARLDRVMNPIPLFVNHCRGAFRETRYEDFTIKLDSPNAYERTNAVIAVHNLEMTYDLLMGKWLPPWGDGVKGDVQFVFNERILGWKKIRHLNKQYRYEVEVSFPGEGNGLIEIPKTLSEIGLRWAPRSGYQPHRHFWTEDLCMENGKTSNFDKMRNYAFRIRTTHDKEGNVVSGIYGKIYGGFDLDGLEGVKFLYYLNLTPNDRNLEFNRKKNLNPNEKDKPRYFAP